MRHLTGGSTARSAGVINLRIDLIARIGVGVRDDAVAQLFLLRRGQPLPRQACRGEFRSRRLARQRAADNTEASAGVCLKLLSVCQS